MSKVPPQKVDNPVVNAVANAIDDVELMQYADGELDEQTAEQVQAALAGDAGARAKVQAMGQVRDTLRSYLELAADDVEPRLDNMWATIERRIQANGVASPARAAEAVPDTVPARQPETRPARQARQRGLWAAVTEWLEAHRGHFVTGMVTAGAVAALVLALRPPREVVKIVERPVLVSEGNNQTAVANETKVNVSTPPEVEHLEVTAGAGTVFTIPSEGNDDVATTVIWLDLDESSEIEEPL